MTGEHMNDTSLAAEAANNLSDSISTHTSAVDRLTEALERSRKFSRMMIVITIILVVLTCATLYQGRQSVVACHASNDARSGQIVLWDKTIIPLLTPHTPGDQEKLDTLKTQIDTIFKPRDCGPFQI
jgi:hypothetical protein